MSHAYETTERTDRAGVFFEENKPKHDHGRRSLRAGALATVARGVNAVVQIGSVILLGIGIITGVTSTRRRHLRNGTDTDVTVIER